MKCKASSLHSFEKNVASIQAISLGNYFHKSTKKLRFMLMQRHTLPVQLNFPKFKIKQIKDEHSRTRRILFSKLKFDR